MQQPPNNPAPGMGDSGNGNGADASRLMGIIYDELHRLAHRYMAREGAGHTLQTTALVHEAYLRLARQHEAAWNSRTHFYAVASQMIRRVLVDHARAKKSAKRGDGRPVSVELAALAADRSHGAEGGAAAIDVLALDDALNDLQRLDERQCRVVDLRFFGGLSIEETAEALGLSIGTVKGDWRAARAWLRQRLAG